MSTQPAVYILASRKNGTLYVGVTGNLRRRVYQHRNGTNDGFVQKHAVTHLVYYEMHDDMYSAITREKRLKKWNRGWKLRLIEEMNPGWEDLWPGII